MAIKLVTKSEQQLIEIAKKKTTLLDAIRVMSWNQFKLDNPDYNKEYDDNLKAYANEFGNDWKADPIHEKSLDELVEFIKIDLGFTIEELLEYRKIHYGEKAEIKARVEAKGNFSVSVSNYQEAENDDEFGYPPY
ncbi:hypothetical protein VB711_19075 [Cronbergia sp. UHCC 0137]|uniref:hypothetical protein n=1 Tax=Cronbergia sp. UHCC 0137 TaxID=3110239 RepID=UPI002B1F512B|nr:hypothetical protein [Cronbergia sp. UHCC 0137]MEA5619931.1 hypothetical protein [Cronbergia sp. UHCC 0137]